MKAIEGGRLCRPGRLPQDGRDVAKRQRGAASGRGGSPPSNRLGGLGDGRRPKHPIALPIRALAACLCVAGCAHVRGGGSQDEAEHQIELYCKALHWKDLDAAAAFVIPEHRSRWRRARDAAHDERDLSIDECEEREIRLAPAGDTAVAYVKVRWVRLPDLVEKSDEAEEHWRYRDGSWLLASETGGPMGTPRLPGQ